MKKAALTALLCCPLCAAPAAAQEDLPRFYDDAVAAWAQGRPDDAAGAFKYVVYRTSDTALALAALKDLAVLLAEAGRNAEALPHLQKAAVLAPEDFFVQFELGWNLLSLERYQDARAAFEKASALTADAALSGQAGLGLAIAEGRLRGAARALEALRPVYTRHPQLLSVSAQLIAFYLEKTKKPVDAANFIKEAIEYDPRNLDAEIELARMYEEAEFYLPAWQTYYTLHELDPEEKKFAGRVKQLAKHLKGKTEDLMYWARMSWPAHKNPLPNYGAEDVRLGLYAGPDGVPTQLTEVSFICNSDFELIDARLGPLLTGKASEQWRVNFNPQSRLFELTDSRGTAARGAVNGLRVVPKAKGAVFLLKSPALPPGVTGVNRGDKEVAGELALLMKEKGFWLINATSREAMVSPVTASLADRNKSPEPLRAAAVAVRTRLAWLASAQRHESRDYHLCDSEHCVFFPGMQAENEATAEAALHTRGELLRTPAGVPADARWHKACGGFTASGISDSGAAAQPRLTPFSLYAGLVEAPPPALNCMSDDRTRGADVTWTLLLRPKWIESRLNRRHKIGYLKALVPLGRDARGTVTALRAEGTAGSAVIKGEKEVAAVLSAGALRSGVFAIRPLYYGKLPEYFLLRGSGTGDGRGLCLLGSRGLAARRGARYKEILRHYFPEYPLAEPAPLRRGKK